MVIVNLLCHAYHYSLQDLGGDGWQNPLIVVFSDACEDTWELSGYWPEEDTQCDVYVLQIDLGGRFKVKI